MDGRQVEDVEAQLGHVGQPGDHILEGAVAARLGRGGAGEELVPGREAGERAVHLNLQLALVAAREAARQVGRHKRCQLRMEGGGMIAGPQALLIAPQSRRIRLRGVGRGLGHQLSADQQVHAHILAGLDALMELMLPCAEAIHPADHGVAVAPELADGEAAAPAVVHQRLHGRFAPIVVARAAVADRAGDHIVAIGEGVALNDDHVADHALDRVAPTIDLWRYPLDHHPAAALADCCGQSVKGGCGLHRRARSGLFRLRRHGSSLLFCAHYVPAFYRRQFTVSNMAPGLQRMAMRQNVCQPRRVELIARLGWHALSRSLRATPG